MWLQIASRRLPATRERNSSTSRVESAPRRAVRALGQLSAGVATGRALVKLGLQSEATVPHERLDIQAQAG
jgi:hypothetical protein